MSAEEATRPEAGGGGEAARPDERPVQERAEEIVERASERVVWFVRRVVGRAREEVEDIVAEGRHIARGERRPG